MLDQDGSLHKYRSRLLLIVLGRTNERTNERHVQMSILSINRLLKREVADIGIDNGTIGYYPPLSPVKLSLLAISLEQFALCRLDNSLMNT